MKTMESEMKKLFASVLSLLACGAVYALPVGNPSEASLFFYGVWWDYRTPCNPCDPCFSWCDAWNLRIGYMGDFVFNRNLQIHTDDQEGSDIDRTSIFTNAGYVAFNICNRVDIFGTLGASKLHIKTDARSWGFTGLGSLESELFFSTEFSWSVGGRATLWQCDCFTVGIEGQYFQTEPNFDNFLEYRAGTLTYFEDASVRYSDWQVGLGISYRLATSCPTFAMVPYAAVTWSGARLNFKNFSFVENFGGNVVFPPSTLRFPALDNGKLWGYALGISLTLCDAVGVTVEGRFAAEKALYVNGQFRF
jgi:major outer membrane protein